jgi:hypothetical protein
VRADGDIADAEIERPDRPCVLQQSRSMRRELHALLNTFCEDSLSSDPLKSADTRPVDQRTRAGLMPEIQDPTLRRKRLRLRVELAEADAHGAEGESIVLVAAAEHWVPHHDGSLAAPRGMAGVCLNQPTAHRWAGAVRSLSKAGAAASCRRWGCRSWGLTRGGKLLNFEHSFKPRGEQ